MVIHPPPILRVHGAHLSLRPFLPGNALHRRLQFQLPLLSLLCTAGESLTCETVVEEVCSVVTTDFSGCPLLVKHHGVPAQ